MTIFEKNLTAFCILIFRRIQKFSFNFNEIKFRISSFPIWKFRVLTKNTETQCGKTENLLKTFYLCQKTICWIHKFQNL